MTNGLSLDMAAMIELANRHPDELEQLRSSLIHTDGPETAGTPTATWLPCDRFNRALNVGSLVLTSDGERARVSRFDRKSERALVELEHGGTRLLKLSKIELRRGRPRKNSYASH